MNRYCGCNNFSRFQGISDSHSNHCGCNQHRNNDCGCNKHRNDNHQKDDCCCTDTMAKQLKKLEGQLIAVYEKGYIAVGVVERVKNNEVLVLSAGFKIVLGTVPVGIPPIVPFAKAFISICEISEFTTFPGMMMTAADLLASLQSS